LCIENEESIYKILQSEYAIESENDKRFLKCLCKFVMRNFVQRLAEKEKESGREDGFPYIKVKKEAIKDLARYLQKDFDDGRLVEQECLDNALLDYKERENGSLGIKDYYDGFSDILSRKLLKNGYFYGKDLSEKEIQSVKDGNRIGYLKQLNLLDHTLETLVELHNSLQKEESGKNHSEKHIMVDKILKEVINYYLEHQETMEKEEMYSLTPIAFVEDIDIYKKLLGGVLKDIETDILFDPLKVKVLGQIVIASIASSQKKLEPDDVMMCIKKVVGKIKDLTIDDKNENLQQAMDALCDLLFVAGAHLQVTGVANDKKIEIQNSLKYLKKHGLETVYKKVAKKSGDPSLRIKRNYALESLSNIGGTKYEKWEANQKLLESSLAFGINTAAGVFTGKVFSIASSLQKLKEAHNGSKSKSSGGSSKDSIIKGYEAFKKEIESLDAKATSQEMCRKLVILGEKSTSVSFNSNWYDRVNDLRTVEMLSISDVFNKIYFVNSNYLQKDEFVTYYSAKLLVNIASDTMRKSYEHIKAIKGLYAIYKNCTKYDLNIMLSQKSSFDSAHRTGYDIAIAIYNKVKIGAGNFANTSDIKFYIKQELGKVYNGSINETVKDACLRVLNILCEEEGEIASNYLNVAVSNKEKTASSRAIVEKAIKNGLSLDYAFADLRKKCTDYYEKEIAPLCLVQVEGDKYNSGHPVVESNKNEHKPLWSDKECAMYECVKNQ